VDDSAPCLIDDSIPQLAVLRDLLTELLDHRPSSHVDPFDPGGFLDHPPRVGEHLLGDAD